MLKRSQFGFTLIESMLGMLILSVLLGFVVPSFRDWIQNAQIRTTAEAIQNGLQLAKGAGVMRNNFARFQFTSSLQNDCNLSMNDANWIVSLDDPSNACATQASDNVAPRIVQARPATESAARVSSAQSSFLFNGLGRLAPIPVNDVAIDVTQGSIADCISAGGRLRCLRVVVSTAGQIHVCDPAIANLNDTRACR